MGIVVSDSYKRNTGPLTFVDEVQGAWRTVATIADLNAIPGEDTQTGQVVYVQDTSELYIATTTLNAQYKPQVSWSLTSFSPAVNLQIAANAGLLLQSNTLSTIYNTNLASSLAVPTAVGGIDAGTTVADLNTKTIVEILNDLLFPTVLASSSSKLVTLSISGGGGNKEVGEQLTETLTATFNQGSITNGDGSAGPPLVGPANEYTFTGTGIIPPAGISQTGQSSNTLSITWDVVLGDNDWDVVVNHDAGTGVYRDNKGNIGDNLNISRAAGTVSDTDTSPNITGYYPYYWGVSDNDLTSLEITNLIQGGNPSVNKVIGNVSGNINITFGNTSAKFLWMVHQANYTTKTKWYISELNNGNIGSTDDLFGPVATSSLDTDHVSNLSYRFYISEYPTTPTGTIQFQNS